MIELPFHNDFYSLVSPKNKDEIVKHCLNPFLELPKDDENFEWGSECLSEKVGLKPIGFTELLEPYIIQVLNGIIDEGTPYGFTIEEVWKNTYHRYYHQEQHDHLGYELSFVIFMNDSQENAARLYFVNERIRVTSPSWIDISTLMGDNFSIEERKGDIIFFPSHMLHGVSPHRLDTPRTTISGNISVGHQIGKTLYSVNSIAKKRL